MNVKQYFKNLWNDLVNDESGQWGGYTLPTSYTAKGKHYSPYTPPKTTSIWDIASILAPKAPTTTTYTPYLGTPPKPALSPPSGGRTTQPVTPATSQLPALTAALSYPTSGRGDFAYTPTTTTTEAYTPPQYNVNLPTIDWGFYPTAEQRGGWQTQAQATAAQEINPQLLAIKAALDQYLTQGQNVRAELNPRYTNQSLAIANIIQNTVKQEAINQAIRRGAETSGWLPSALMQAGQLETQQRGDIETQRNQDLAALAALEAQQTQAAGEQGTMLEGLRGQRITTALAELENQAWQRSQQEKQNIWQSALGGEQLRASAFGDYAQNMLGAYQTQAGIAQSEADRALQAAIADAEQRNVQWQQQFATSQSDYERQLAASQLAQSGIKAKEPTYNVNVNGQIIPMTQSQYLNWFSGTAPTQQQAGGMSDFERWIMSQIQ